MRNKKWSRRDFLQTTAGVAAGAAAVGGALKAVAGEAPAAPAAGAAKVDDRPFKLGLIGCGSQARLNLMPAALRVPGIKFTAVCDVIPARSADAQKIAGGTPKVFDDWKALLKDADMDAVMIVTPLTFHRPMVEEAFKCGRHVFCEKTMAYSIDDAKAMLKAQMAAGKILQIGHHLRYHPLYHFAKGHFIDKGLLGKVNNIHCQWNRNGTWRRPPEPMPGVDFKKWGYDTEDEVLNWRLYRKYSGGLMTELASHQLDIMNWFLEDKLPEAVVGVGKIDNKDGRTILDNVHLIYEYPDGLQMTYESITTNAFSPFGETYELIQGEKGTLVMAHLSKFVGLFFLEPGVAEQLWMPAAHREKLESPNITAKEYKSAIVLNGTPSPGTRLEKVAGMDMLDLVDTNTATVKKTTYEIELIGFKTCVLDKVNPLCDGMVGLKSAVPALLGLEAMEKNQRIVIDPKIIALA
jgi:predicted dehydrogenase